MRIHFDDTRRPARVAKLLRAAFAAHGANLGLSKAQDLTARLYGYATFHELRMSCGRNPASAWDEACTAEVVAERRAGHLAVLVPAGLPREKAEAFLDDARPTARSRRGMADGPAASTLPKEASPIGAYAREIASMGGEAHGFAGYLVSKGLVDAEQVDAALRDQRHAKELLGHILVRRGAISPEALIDAVLDYDASRTRAGEGANHDGVLESLLRRALKEGVGEIHVEPRHDCYAVFFRRLGERSLAHMGSREEYEVVVAMLKDRSRMDLSERKLGQDGGFQVEHEGRFVDLRVATVPAFEGEQAIVRFLDPDRVRPALDQLGISGAEKWRRGITRKNGLCLICGDTGSGKTTTLNASVRELDRFGRKIYTAEDPIEYRIPYVGQVSMNSGVGYGFAKAIRNFMRSEPDVMVMGEVRDTETARNLVKAAETGHLVMANVSTGSILSAVERMRDLGIPPFELRFVLRSVLVQTLVKVVCRSCGGHGHAHGVACDTCHGTGYSDRTVVSECHSFNSHAEVDDILAMLGRARGRVASLPWKTMLDDAIDKMRSGITTSDELLRTFGHAFLERLAEMDIDPEAFRLPRLRHEPLVGSNVGGRPGTIARKPRASAGDVPGGIPVSLVDDAIHRWRAGEVSPRQARALFGAAFDDRLRERGIQLPPEDEAA